MLVNEGIKVLLPNLATSIQLLHCEIAVVAFLTVNYVHWPTSFSTEFFILYNIKCTASLGKMI